MTTAAVLSPSPIQKFWANDGTPLVGGTVTTYAAGTSTPIATYTDYTALTPNSNPITLNYRGEASIWLLPNVAYKFVVNDSLGNTISTTDQITVSQLLTLFAGVDTGIANNYIVNFIASFSALANGIVLYFVPANNNTGASTLNVNGLGVIPIINVDGSALGANQITAGQMVEVVYYNGNWQLITISAFSGSTIGTFGISTTIPSASTTDLGSATAHVVLVTGTTTITSFGSSASLSAPIYMVRFSGALTLTAGVALILPGAANIPVQAGDSLIAQYLGSGNWTVLSFQANSWKPIQYGSFTGTLTGMSGSTTGTVTYLITGGTIRLWLNGGAITGTSNTTAMTMTGLPAAVTPTSARAVSTFVENNSVTSNVGLASVSSSSVITFGIATVSGSYTPINTSGFTNSGTKGLGADWTISYPL